MGWASGFASGAATGRSLIDTYLRAKDARERDALNADLAEISRSKVGEQVIGAKMPEGDMEEGSGGQVPVPESRKFTFLGQEFDKAPDEAQMSRARQLAMAGVFEERGAPERGMALRNAVSQADATAEDRAFQGKIRPLQLAGAQRQDRMGAQAEADADAVRAIDADVGKFIEQRLTGPDGQRRAVTPDDHVAATLYRAGALQRAGKTEAATKAMQEYSAAAFGKIQLETAQRTDAARQAAAGVRAGQFDGVVRLFNEFIPDGSTVVDVKRGADGKVQVVREVDGKRMKPEVMTVDELLIGVEAAADPTKAWQMSMQLAAEARLNRGEARADRAEGRAAGAYAAGATGRDLARQIDVHRLTLADPKSTPAARQEAEQALSRLSAATSTGRGDQPAQVQLAEAIVRAGLRPDMKSALEFAMTSKDKSPEALRADLLKTALTANMGDAARAKATVDELMGYLQGAQGGAGAAGAAAAGPAKGAVVDGWVFQGGDPSKRENWKPAK